MAGLSVRACRQRVFSFLDTIIPGTAHAVSGIIVLHLYHETVVFRASGFQFL